MQCTALGTSCTDRHFLYCVAILFVALCSLHCILLRSCTVLHFVVLQSWAVSSGVHLPTASIGLRWELVGLKSKIQVSDDVSSENWNGNWTSKTSPLKTKSPKIGQSHPGRFPGSFNLWPLSSISTLVGVLYSLYQTVLYVIQELRCSQSNKDTSWMAHLE